MIIASVSLNLIFFKTTSFHIMPPTEPPRPSSGSGTGELPGRGINFMDFEQDSGISDQGKDKSPPLAAG